MVTYKCSSCGDRRACRRIGAGRGPRRGPGFCAGSLRSWVAFRPHPGPWAPRCNWPGGHRLWPASRTGRANWTSPSWRRRRVGQCFTRRSARRSGSRASFRTSRVARVLSAGVQVSRGAPVRRRHDDTVYETAGHARRIRSIGRVQRLTFR